MPWKLWIDDVRPPPDVDWKVAKSTEDAIRLYVAFGWPEFISFDHDLGETDRGIDFVKWLINEDLQYGTMPGTFKFTVHSANPIGAENIRVLMQSYLDYKNKQQSGP